MGFRTIDLALDRIQTHTSNAKHRDFQMNIFLTGASGLLGHAIAKHLIAQGHSVHAATHKTNVSFPELIPHKVDLSRTDQVENTLSKVQP